MSNHTPGPWAVRDHEQYPKGFGVVQGPAFNVTWVRIASDITPEQSEQREIDARLIAAAPELLAALKDALDVMGDWGEDGDPAWATRARLAIAKAEGASNG